MNLAKKRFQEHANDEDFVLEFHGLGSAITHVAEVHSILLGNGYVEEERVKTKTENLPGRGGRLRRVPKLIVKFTRSKDFDKVCAEFEK